MDEQAARDRFAWSPVARLATVRPGGAPHVVPVVFALRGDVVYTAVDHKPKTTMALQRLVNLRREPRCSLLVDHYDDDWTRLWWVRADGRATILDEPGPGHEGVLALVERYATYQRRPPAGPLIRIQVTSWRSWASG